VKVSPQAVRKGVAREIRRVRIAAGISQRELAGLLARSPSWVSRVERAARGLKLDELGDIGVALGVDPVQLLAEGRKRRVRKTPRRETPRRQTPGR
jgi:transcriptional regulator with XRE-family HTH domain